MHSFGRYATLTNTHYLVMSINLIQLGFQNGTQWRVPQKNVTTCYQTRIILAILGVSFCVSRNAFKFTEIKTRTQGHSSASLLLPYVVFKIYGASGSVYVTQKNPHYEKSIVTFDSFLLNIIFTQISSCMRVFNFEKYVAPIIHI